MYLKFTVLIIIFFLPLSIFSQTCCSAGTPILSAINISTTNGGQWQFSLTAEHNSIQDVLPGTISPREERFTNSLLFDVSYGISERFSITFIVPYVQLSQTPLFGSQGQILTNGIGDILSMIKYNIIPVNFVNQNQLAVGYGLKLPSGRSDLRGGLGAILVPQLQPGTGSWDHILWGFYSQNFRPEPISLFFNLNYRLNGDNNRFQTSGPFSSYKFGNVFSSALGLSYRLSPSLDLSALVRYRYTEKDLFADVEVPNTGGDWVYLVPAVNINFDPYGLRFSGQLPVFRNLSGIQITTSFTVSASFYYFIW
jgi:hypothetical protein